MWVIAFVLQWKSEKWIFLKYIHIPKIGDASIPILETWRLCIHVLLYGMYNNHWKCRMPLPSMSGKPSYYFERIEWTENVKFVYPKNGVDRK